MHVCTHVGMYIHTYGHLRPALLGQLWRRIDPKIKAVPQLSAIHSCVQASKIMIN